MTQKGLLLSDFTVDELGVFLNNDDSDPTVQMRSSGFGPVLSTLMNDSTDLFKDIHFAVIWTLPDGIPSFTRLLQNDDPPLQQILDDVDVLADAILKRCEILRFGLVMSWVLPPHIRGRGLLDLRPGGVHHALLQMNLRMAERLQESSNIYLLNTQSWISDIGGEAFSPKKWFMGKIPFHHRVFERAAKEIKSAIRTITGHARKLIVIDLDDTLWGGIAGDVGWPALRLGGNNPAGEAFQDFQRELKALTRKGILLAIASKNEKATALEAIEKHPEMILRLQVFAAYRIDWNDKAANIVQIAEELNLGLDSIVFIDDSAAERARVREALPDVFVPDWPIDKTLYPSTLLRLDCFDTISVTQEDGARSRMMAEEGERKSAREKIGSIDEWLKSLEIRIQCQKLNDANLDRAVQLLNKTNQMNLSTRRMTKDEVLTWSQNSNHRFWTLRISDRFGAYGLTGLLSVELSDSVIQMVDFVLSCRVFGRQVEHAMLAFLIQWAHKHHIKQLAAEFLPTEKNQPTSRFLRESGMIQSGDNMFQWQTSDLFSSPGFITWENDDA